MGLDAEKMKAIVEAMLFVSQRPVTMRQIVARLRLAARRDHVAAETTLSEPSGPLQDVDAVLHQLMEHRAELENDISREDVVKTLENLRDEYARLDRGIELVYVAKGYQLRTKYEISDYLRDDKKPSLIRFSPSSLETLAIIAYKQPVSRSLIESVRGVDTGGVLKTLLERDFIRIVGRAEEPGRPLVYGTTTKFLEIFGLGSLSDLPNPREFLDMGAMSGDGELVDESNGDDGRFIAAGDFVESGEIDLSESEQEILQELDQSLDELKKVEKTITVFGDDKGEPEKVG